MFKEIDVKEKATDLENRINKFWSENKIAQKSIDIREGDDKFIFYEGPPTANGMPGIHHAISRTLKDVVCRYKTMQGFQVKRKAGWDTHGLPVEIEVQKQIGISDKREIEEYGIEEFNKKCRESVFKYEKEWRQMTELLGYWLDLDNPYITLKPDYMESVWWLLHQFWKNDMIYSDKKIVPFCPSCGTPLSSHEVAQGYEQTKDPSIFIKFKVKGEENTYFLAWTTTPWTLISNVALVVHPNFDYVKIKVDEEYFILAEKCLDVIEEDYKIVEKYIGVDLENKEYEQLFPFIKPNKKAFYVALGDYVTLEDGTGIVHTAPAFGEEDFMIGKRYDLPFIQPVDEKGYFTEEITDWAGQFIKKADPGIMRDLKDRNLLYKKSTIVHTYPFCWRCDSPLIYFARKSWYIKTTEFKEQMIENNKNIEWHPKYVGKGRFGDWLENNIDWAISRDRFWGTPLNIWICPKCGKQESVESINGLRENGKMKDGSAVPEDIDLHRPYVDEIVLECPECGEKMQRTPEVIDCWFDSGSMPFAQCHYPFENKDNFTEDWFPADFIAEGIDQTRGWFYTLLAISTYIKGESSYKRCLVNDLVLDKKGKKMSKSRGNTLDVFQVLDTYGADATRWFMLAVSPPWTPTKFDQDGIDEVYKKFFGTLKNVLSFFITYANIDDFEYENFEIEIEDRPEVDRWIVSRLNSVIKQVTKYTNNYNLTKAVREIQSFVVDEVSNWYVRRIRKRCWAAGMEDDKVSAYMTLYEVLKTTALLIAPYAPFISEEIYKTLTNEESVHLADYPVYKEKFINTTLEEEMKVVIDVVTLARAARNEVQIKVRQPLPTLYVPKKHKEVIEKMKDLIVEEINIKDIEYVKDKTQFISYDLKPNFKVLGPKYGKHMPAIAQALNNVDGKNIVQEIREKGVYHMDIDTVEVKLNPDSLEINAENKEGYAFQQDENTFVALDITIDEDLRKEGHARELVNKIQFMRKENDYDIMDRIKIKYYTENEEIVQTINEYDKYISEETLARDIVSMEDDSDMKEWNINNKKVYLQLEVVE
ncbi:MAG: isoleucine--tRNA ligase [Candidatus Cloacimonetes bacterium]|nr:isoleucine--tRNA ligase [Candidatus Cloacimonadota bacterium]MBS3767187.1 isoleucine--tRNA ligase [Candidatus Cloacimonadota bacterium]